VPVAVAEGQRVEVALEIATGGVIEGVITDAQGRPAPNVALAIVGVGTPESSATPQRTVTDDRGMYRVFGLAPGEYLVAALPRLGASSGRGAPFAVISVSDAEVRWAQSAGGAAAIPMPAPGRPVAYAPVFYPGTTDAAQAATIAVSLGEERRGIGFAIQAVQTARIAGTIVDAGGQPIMATVSLYPRRRDRTSPADTLVSSGALTLPRATVSATGFSIDGVAPGEYTMLARSGSGSRGAQPLPATTALWSVTDLVVDGRDQTGLVLRLEPGLRLSGRIIFEHTTLTPPDDMSTIDLLLRASGSSLGTASTPRARVEPDGTFAFTSLVPWIYTLGATPPGAATGARWILESAMLDGRDLAEGAFEVRHGHDVSGLVITFTDRAASISGRLVDAGGRPVTRYAIVVFPADRALWLPASRRIRSVPPATDGSFAIDGLPAGNYAIAAAEDVLSADLADPGFLEQLLASAIELSLSKGEQKRQDLRVGR
jgi:hypothetical protein